MASIYLHKDQKQTLAWLALYCIEDFKEKKEKITISFYSSSVTPPNPNEYVESKSVLSNTCFLKHYYRRIHT